MRIAVAVMVVAGVLSVSSHAAEPLISFDDFSAPGITRSLSAENLRLACLRRDPPPAPPFNLRETDCRHTVGAVLDAVDAIEAVHPAARMFCPDVRPVPWEDAADVYVAWADRHPDKLRAPSVWPLLSALKERWPCPEKES